MLNPRKSKPCEAWTICVLSSLKVRPLGASQPTSCALTCSACCLVRQHTTRSSAYLTTTGEPGLACPAREPVGKYRTPAASSSPCKAMFSSKGETTPPTQLVIRRYFAVRVGVGAVVGPAAHVVPYRDGVADGDLVGADEHVFDEQAQDALAFGDGRCGGLSAPPGGGGFEGVGGLEGDLPGGGVGVERGGLGGEAGLAGAPAGDAGPGG